MGTFSGDLVVKFIDPETYELMQPFSYTTNDGEVIEAPTGFKTDFATIPRVFWVIVAPDDIAKAAVIHDKLCVDLSEETTVLGYYNRRKKADKIFLEAILVNGFVKNTIARKVYLAVRTFTTCKSIKIAIENNLKKLRIFSPL